jgi:methyl-accepting chemotaxis protein
MFTSTRQTLTRIADGSSWLALLTSLLFAAFTVLLLHPLLLLASAGYAIFAVYGMVQQQRRRQQTRFSSFDRGAEADLEETRIPQQSLYAISSSVEITVDGLVRASDAITQVTNQQVNSAEEQTQIITSANRTLEQFLAFSERVQQQARDVTRTAREAAEISEQGRSVIQQSQHNIQDIRAQVETIVQTITRLAQLTERIDEIITSVGEIATQSNLLALNASIEAARAGASGRGFSVVADEVRALAQQSTQSAAQVRAILREIQQAMRDAVGATRSGLEHVEEGVSHTDEANALMSQLVYNAQEAQQAVAHIYEVIRQQASDLEEISIVMDRIQRLTTQSVANARVNESVSENLGRLAKDLQSAMQLTADL